jgi:hypothetical protein
LDSTSLGFPFRKYIKSVIHESAGEIYSAEKLKHMTLVAIEAVTPEML